MSRLRCMAIGALLAVGSIADGQPMYPAGFSEMDVVTGLNLPTSFVFAPDGDAILVAEKAGVVKVARPVLQDEPFIDLSEEVYGVANRDKGLIGLALHPGFAPDGGEASWVYLLYTADPAFDDETGIAGDPDAPWSSDGPFTFGRLVRYRAVTQPDGDIVADGPSRHVLIGRTHRDAIPSPYKSHTVGDLAFGFDGSLFVSAGDGASFNYTDVGCSTTSAEGYYTAAFGTGPDRFDPGENIGAYRALDLDSLCGKILRIDPETGLGLADNPHAEICGAVDLESARAKVWARGLRNPFRFAVVPDTPGPGALVVGDVGWNDWEELDWIPATGGGSCGWPVHEGFFLTPDNARCGRLCDYIVDDAPCPPPNPCDAACTYRYSCSVPYHLLESTSWTQPILAVPHVGLQRDVMPESLPLLDADGAPSAQFEGRTMVGGSFYTGGGHADPSNDYPDEYAGRYFFADFDSRWMRTALLDAKGEIVEVREFASYGGTWSGLDGYFVRIQAHPVTGDIHFCVLGNAGSQTPEGRIVRIAHGASGDMLEYY